MVDPGGVSGEDRTAVEGTRPTQRMMAAITSLEEDGATMEAIAQRYGYTAGWLTRFERLESEPFEAVVDDEDRSGRPPELTDQETQQFDDILHDPPEAVGLDAPA